MNTFSKILCMLIVTISVSIWCCNSIETNEEESKPNSNELFEKFEKTEKTEMIFLHQTYLSFFEIYKLVTILQINILNHDLIDIEIEESPPRLF